MRRIKLVVALVAVLEAMFVGTAGPAMADHTNRHENRQDRHDNRWDHRWDNRWDNRWDHRRHFDDVDVVFVPAFGFWNWHPSWGWFWDDGCGFDWDGPVTPLDCWD